MINRDALVATGHLAGVFAGLSAIPAGIALTSGYTVGASALIGGGTALATAFGAVACGATLCIGGFIMSGGGNNTGSAAGGFLGLFLGALGGAAAAAYFGYSYLANSFETQVKPESIVISQSLHQETRRAQPQ